MYLDANNLYRWAMSQKLFTISFKGVKKLSKFDKDFIKNYNEYNDKGYILETDVKYPKSLFNLHKDLPLSAERRKINNARSLFVVYMTKKTMLSL